MAAASAVGWASFIVMIWVFVIKKSAVFDIKFPEKGIANAERRESSDIKEIGVDKFHCW
jgi:hypothetical protein